jgi:serine/threonine kinase PknH
VTVFVSYSSRDRDAVKGLSQDLQDADERVWMDQRLAGGDAWWRAILEQVRGCDVFIFALSQNSIESKPCQAELQYARALGLPIVPVQVGPVDSMQLNPLATVQAIDYRHQTPNTGMRLIAALNRERAQRRPLPEPLPEEPPVPFEYLIRLYTTISNPDYLNPRDQAALVAQLQVGLGEDGQHEVARNDIVTLLTKLHDREDATHRTRTDVEAILASVDGQPTLKPHIATEVTTPVEPAIADDAAQASSESPAPTERVAPGSMPIAAAPSDPTATQLPPRKAPQQRITAEPKGPSVRLAATITILGIIVLVVAFLLNIPLAWTIGIVLLFIGVVLAIVRAVRNAVGGRPS